VNWLRALEEKLGGWWEGVSRRSLRVTVQPVEIAKRLVREMGANKRVSIRRIYVPNRYLVYLSPADWCALSAMEQALTEEWAAYLQEKAAERGYTMVGRPAVRVEVDDNLPQGQIRLHSRFSEEEGTPEVESTKPFRATSQLTLRVIKGPDSGLVFSLPEKEIIIGRRPTCHVVLTDANVSRQHAVIERQGDVYWLNDLGSTNGTFVNGERVTRQPLRSGDRIRVGDSELEVEVS